MKLALTLALLAGWQPAQPIGPALLGVETSVGADGSVYAATSYLSDRLEWFSAPPGGAFGAPRTLLTGVRPILPGVDATGSTTALYDAAQPGDLGPAGDAPATRSVVAAVAPPGGELGPPALVSTGGRRAMTRDLDVAPSGAAVAAWIEATGRRWRVVAAVRPPGSPVFGPPHVLSGPVAAGILVRVAAGERGDAIVRWGSRVAVAREGRFGTPVGISSSLGDVRLAVGADGTAVVAVENRALLAPRRSRRFRVFETPRCDRAEAAAVAPDGRALVACRGGPELSISEGRARLRRTARFTIGVGRVAVATARGGRAVVAWGQRAAFRARAGGRFERTTVGADSFAAHLLDGGGAIVLADRADTLVAARYAAMKLALALTLVAGWQGAQTIAPFSLEGATVSTGADGTAYVAGLQSGTADRDAWVRGRSLDSGALQNVAVGLDASGAATALLAERGSGRLAAAVAPPGAGLGAPVWLSAAGHSVKWGELTVAPGGAAIATWVQRDGGHWRVVAAVREPGAAVFGPPRTVSGPVVRRTFPTAGVSSRGDALIVWTGADWTKRASASLRRPGGRFSTPVLVADYTGTLRLAVGEDGTAVLSVAHARQQNLSVYVVAPAAARLGRAQSLPCGWASGANAAAANGRVMVVCRGEDHFEIWEGTAGLALRRTDRLSARKHVGEDSIRAAVGPDGRAVITWTAEGPFDRVAREAPRRRRPATGRAVRAAGGHHARAYARRSRWSRGWRRTAARPSSRTRPTNLGPARMLEIDRPARGRVAGWTSTGW